MKSVDKKNKSKKQDKEDKETLQPKSTDPQDGMEGPVSSIMQNIKEKAEENDKLSKEEATRKRDENL